MEDMDALEEERRLFYVGVTRAKDRLYLLHTFKRTQYGSTEFSEPSRFLSDIPDELIEGQEKKPARQISLGMGAGRYRRTGSSMLPSPAFDAKPDKPKPSVARFQTGDKVAHATFGEGTVIESKLAGGDEEVSVAFKGRGIKRLLAEYLVRVDL
jgi:DNA helicase-2/ATP-dependent DNA helicase PcrA